MERKELISTSPSGNPDYQYYLKNEADAVMDAYEARIKELEEEIQRNKVALKSMNFKYLDRNTRIKELGERILERNKTVCEQTARIKELEALQPKWISVKVRMPLTIRPVLSSIYGLVMVDSWNGDCWESNCHITHWMPLPNPPTAEDSSDAGGKK